MLSPYTAVTADSDGEPVEGTMVDNGAVNYSLSVNGSYNIPQGYHNGQGKVTQNIATMNGSTVNPSTSTVTIATDKKYVNGNFIIPGFSLPNANVIKKGVTVTIYGRSVTGTFEGWVPSPTDWYYNGVIASGFRAGEAVIVQNTRLLINRSGNANVYNNSSSINVQSFNTLTLEGSFLFNASGVLSARVIIGTSAYYSNEKGGNNFSRFTINISQAISGTISIYVENVKPMESYITRIGVS